MLLGALNFLTVLAHAQKASVKGVWCVAIALAFLLIVSIIFNVILAVKLKKHNTKTNNK